MNIAILGATSQIAKDLILGFSAATGYQLHLFARRIAELSTWLELNGLSGRYPVNAYAEFPKNEFDAVINFVGAGDPAQIAAMGSTIFDITLRFDEMVLEYLRTHPSCRYLFLSSGAAYGSNFEQPATRETAATIRINNLKPQDWYGVAKLHAECRHRALAGLPIIDIRVFNYFSRTQDINARFLIADMLRAIRDKTVLKTSSDYIVRDYLHPSDFYRLVTALLTAPAANAAVDCYSKAPIDKPSLLQAMENEFGLRYEVTESPVAINATGGKPHYYSLNIRAADFGYEPRLTSLEGILIECGALVHNV
ncbi:MAG: NAD-dependent epimerase/dehydratase family protein [Gallionella sp.]|nr:NAD-dependent epimerase/dehydratase family protein [Gallionella sp.]